MGGRAATHAVGLRTETARPRTGWLVVLAGLALVVGRPARAGALGDTHMVGVHESIVYGSLSAQYPAAGALLVGDDPTKAVSMCSGVLIGCQTFLTAAHCVCTGDGAGCQGSGAPKASGSLVFFQNAGFFRVASIVVHPDYHFPWAGDLAVLRLATPVTGI